MKITAGTTGRRIEWLIQYRTGEEITRNMAEKFKKYWIDHVPPGTDTWDVSADDLFQMVDEIHSLKG